MRTLKTLLFMMVLLPLFASAQVVKTGLIGYWPFTGNANDSSANTNHGTVFGATLTADRFGNQNSAYRFDGADDYIHIGNQSVLKPASITVNVWFKNIDTTRLAYLFGSSNAGYGEWGIDIHQRKLQGICSGLGAGASNRHIGYRSGNWYADTLWHMATITYDVANPLTCSMYVDAVYLGNPNSVGSSGSFFGSDKMKFNSVDSWYFGVAAQYFTHPTANNGPLHFKGDLDDGAIYNRALTECEVRDLYLEKPIDLIMDTTFVTIVDTTYVTIIDTSYVKISVTDTLIINAKLTGISKPNNIVQMLVYPNPTKDKVTIDVKDFARMSGYSMKITDALSKEVWKADITKANYVLDLNSFGGFGTYFITIYDNTNNMVDVRKIILQ